MCIYPPLTSYVVLLLCVYSSISHLCHGLLVEECCVRERVHGLDRCHDVARVLLVEVEGPLDDRHLNRNIRTYRCLYSHNRDTWVYNTGRGVRGIRVEMVRVSYTIYIM